MKMMSSPFGAVAVVALMGIWFYLGTIWAERARVTVEPTSDPRMMHCFLTDKRTLCHIELQSWDSRWGFEYGKSRE